MCRRNPYYSSGARWGISHMPAEGSKYSARHGLGSVDETRTGKSRQKKKEIYVLGILFKILVGCGTFVLGVILLSLFGTLHENSDTINNGRKLGSRSTDVCRGSGRGNS